MGNTANVRLLFPPQQTLSIKKALNTALPDFIPHAEIIFMGISELFESHLTSFDTSFLNKLKAGSDDNKALAAEVARWHNQLDFAKECVQDVDNALCKRMHLMLDRIADKRVPLTDDEKKAYERDEDHQFVAIDYNFQTFNASTSDPNDTEAFIKQACDDMGKLIATDKCSWRFHLIYAAVLSRTTLDTKAVQHQLDLAQTKLNKQGVDANSHYPYQAMLGDVYYLMRDTSKAQEAFTKAIAILPNDGFCRPRLIAVYLMESKFNEAMQVWQACCSDLKSGGVNEDAINCFTNYLKLASNPDDQSAIDAILAYNGDDESSYIGVPLKLYVMAYKTDQFKEDKLTLNETPENEKATQWADRKSDFAKAASSKRRVVSQCLKMMSEMFVNDGMEDYEYQGSLLNNMFSSFPKPLTDDLLDALCYENYLLGMFKLKWKADCKKQFKYVITCNCRGNMNAYIGEVIGFQNAGMADIAVQKIESIQRFVNVEALELFPIDAKRMSQDESGEDMKQAEQQLISIIQKKNRAWDAYLALADLYISTGKWQSAMLLMQQPIENEPVACSNNFELRLKWATILFFNNYLPAAMKVFNEYTSKDLESSAHEYYCAIAANVYFELDQGKKLTAMGKKNKLKGQNVWILRYQCYKFWIAELKKKPDKVQYDKAIDCAKKMIRLDENYPLGHALLARSNIAMEGIVDNIAEQIEESVNKAVELADKLVTDFAMLPRMYYETMVHCGVAMYQIGKDGSEYYQKAVDTVPHGEIPLLKSQRERITSKLTPQQTRDILKDILKTGLNRESYQKVVPRFQFDLNNTVSLAQSHRLGNPTSPLLETGQNGVDITKPEEAPAASAGGGGGGAAKAKPAAAKKPKAAAAAAGGGGIPPPPPPEEEKKAVVPDTDDSKAGGGGGDDAGLGIVVDSPFNYSSMCSYIWPSEKLVFSLPFDDAVTMGEALTVFLRERFKEINLAPQDENDLIGRLHWGGDDALQEVLDKCEGQSDALHLGLANFAYLFKMDLGIASEDHRKCVEEMMEVTKHLTYEGKLGLACLKGLQCVTYEADDYFKGLLNEKDADGSDWLCRRHYGHYLFFIKHDYAAGVQELQKAYKNNPKKDPMTIGWYMAALAKSGTQQDIQTMATVFDEIGKFHDGHSDAAVIREEFLNLFDIKDASKYDALAKSGPTGLLRARQLICRAKYDRKSIDAGGGIKKITKDIKAGGADPAMFKILIPLLKTQGNWYYNNSVGQCIDGMTDAGMVCMDWILSPVINSYCFAKRDDWETAEATMAELPQKNFEPISMVCASMTTGALSELIEDIKDISPDIFIARINNLRFQQKKTDVALKELTSEFLEAFKQDFNALVALAGIYLNKGALTSAYQVFYTIRQLYPMRYRLNFLLRFEFAECMRMNGFQSEAWSEFRAVYESWDHSKKSKMDFEAITDLLLGFIFQCLSVGDYATAEDALDKCSKRHKLYKLANGELTLMKHAGDASKCKSVFEDCKDEKLHPMIIALAIRAAKLGGESAGECEETLKKLLAEKFEDVASVKEYCELSAGIVTESSNQCLSNAILAAVMKNGADTATKIYEALKAVYANNKYPSAQEILAAVSAFGVSGIDDVNLTLMQNAEPPKIADITDDYGALAQVANQEIEEMSGYKEGGKPKKGAGKKGKKGAKGKKGGAKKASPAKGKKGKKADAGGGGGAEEPAAGGGGGGDVKAGPKPKVDYNSTPLDARKKWSFEMAEKLPTPKANDVASWSANDVGNFIAKIPIFGLNEWYGNKFKESGVTGKMFLDCNEQKLVKWGIDKKCHRARFRAEALAMKRRG